MEEKKVEEREKKALKYITENGEASLQDICILVRRSKNPVRALLAKYVHDKTIFMRKVNGANEMYSITPFEEIPEPPKEEPKDAVPKDILLPENPTALADEKFVRIEGIGTISERKLSELFSDGILIIDIDKLIPKLKMGEVAFEKDKLVFEV